MTARGDDLRPRLSDATQQAAPRRRAAERGAPRLVVLHPLGPDLGRRFVLPAGGAPAARGRAVAVPRPSPSVWRRRARLESRGTGWAVMDLGSTNGTFLNGLQVRAGAL